MSVAQPGDVAGQQRFERRVGGERQRQLPHVADVEQPGAGPRPLVLGDDPVVLDRHRIAGERHHARAEPAVETVEGEGEIGRRVGHRAARDRVQPVVHRPRPRLSLAPESFDRADRLTPSVGPAREPSAFQIAADAPARSLVPERLPGAACSFGGGGVAPALSRAGAGPEPDDTAGVPQRAAAHNL